MIEIFTDGACNKDRLAGIGWCAYDGNTKIAEYAGRLNKIATNNIAEFTAVLSAIMWAKEKKHSKIQILSDSQLTVNILSGEWDTKKPWLQWLHHFVQSASKDINVDYNWIPRESNAEADKLACKYKKHEVPIVTLPDVVYKDLLDTANIRFYERNGKKYPSVTTIINYKRIDFPMEKLTQYGDRGTIVHAIIEHYLLHKKLLDIDSLIKVSEPKDAEQLRKAYMNVKYGTLNLSINKPIQDFKMFWNIHSKYIEYKPEWIERKVYSDEHLYAGTADFPCIYKGIPTIADWKTSGQYPKEKLLGYFKQCGAYARADVGLPEDLGDVQQGMIIPLGPREPISNPFMTKEIDAHFGMFMDDRADFKETYGV